MFVEPRPADLIARVCESLERTAVGDPAAKIAQRQLKAALFTLRQLQSDLDRRGTALVRDVEEMRALLVACRHPLPEPLPHGSIEQEHLALQERLCALEETVAGTEQRNLQAQLRRLHVEMLTRQLNPGSR